MPSGSHRQRGEMKADDSREHQQHMPAQKANVTQTPHVRKLRTALLARQSQNATSTSRLPLCHNFQHRHRQIIPSTRSPRFDRLPRTTHSHWYTLQKFDAGAYWEYLRPPVAMTRPGDKDMHDYAKRHCPPDIVEHATRRDTNKIVAIERHNLSWGDESIKDERFLWFKARDVGCPFSIYHVDGGPEQT